ncbi:GPW/gp25 family protein [Aeromonas hydrophila]|uniref:hypothetical protein n=1 Tax=Aeromonas hydrophila TaxID=644 RepID=UPI00224FE996|nr:hypothetical protein [Aeromonas hydrophila]MCX4116987.1 hypothetical protein [Aeromonas hydrophila]HEH9401861.1 hypothetical protein [Aeromonas sobria]
MKSGMDRDTGKVINGLPYLRQRLADVINTPIGSLVLRRDFGSRIFEMVDRNVNASFHMDCYVRLAEAINNPANGLDDFRLSEMRVRRLAAAHIEISLSGYLLVNGEPITIDGVVIDGRY